MKSYELNTERSQEAKTANFDDPKGEADDKKNIESWFQLRERKRKNTKL
jgi:hypothetical protein